MIDAPESNVPRAPGLRQIGFADYAVFAVFWSFLYLVVGAPRRYPTRGALLHE